MRAPRGSPQPGVQRAEILSHVRAGKLSRNKAAKMLGLSRQYVGRLVADLEKKERTPMPIPTSTEIPLVTATENTPPPGAAPPLSSPEGRSALDDLLRQAQSAPGPSTQTGTPPPFTPEVITGGAADPEEQAAGEELAKMVAGGFAPYVASRVYSIKQSDPRLDSIRKPSAFTSLALKRNHAICGALGKLTGGWIGIGIAVGVEIWRGIMVGQELDLPHAPDDRPTTAGQVGPRPVPLAEPDEDEEDEERDPVIPPQQGPPAPAFSIRAAKMAASAQRATG